MGGNFLHLAAGGLGATAGVCVTCPLDVVQTRLQSTILNFSQFSASSFTATSTGNTFSPGTGTGTLSLHLDKVGKPKNYVALVWSYMRFMIRTEGLLSLYKGLLPSVLGIAPAKSTYFLVYSYTKRQLNTSSQFKRDSRKVHTISAMSAGLITSTITNPIWFVKTRLQLNTAEKEPLGVLQCIATAYNNEGVNAFFRGLSASYVGVLETVIYFVIYEDIKKRLRTYRAQQSDMKQFHNSDYVTASVTSKLVATLFMYPHEVVRIRLRQDLKDKNGTLKYRNFFQTLIRVGTEEGRVGLYGGFATNIIRQIPNTAVTFLTYEAIVHYFSGGY